MDEILDGVLDVTAFDQLTAANIERLAQFNAESARGLVHTPEYRQRMARLQERWNEHQAQQVRRSLQKRTRRRIWERR